MMRSTSATPSYESRYGAESQAANPPRIAESPPPYSRTPHLSGEADLAGATVLSAHARLARARAAVLVQQCRLLHTMHERKRFHQHGYRNLGDFAQEVLNVAPRTAGRRLRVAKVLTTHRRVEDALLAGELSFCQVEVLAPVITASPGDFEAWVQTAANLSIQELRLKVKEAAAPDHRPSADLRLQIRAPLTTAQAFDHALHAARHVLGWDAPRADCFEAILAEAESSLHHAACPRTRRTARERRLAQAASVHIEPFTRRSNAQLPSSSGLRLPAVPTLQETPALRRFLSLLNDELKDLESLFHHQPQDPVLYFRVLEQSLRPLALLEGRLLLHLRSELTPAHFRHSTWEAVADTLFHMSVRRFRDLIRDAKLLRRQNLESAYVDGTLSLSHLRLIARLECSHQELDEWLQRAQRVTFRQLAREIDLAEKAAHLREPAPWLGDSLAGRPHDGAEQIHDPAANPAILEALEHYVHSRLMQEFPAGVGRQTMADFGPVSTITVQVSHDVFDQWARLRETIQTSMGERVADWVCLVQILNAALTEWAAEEQKPRSLAQRIVQRDDYHCTAPGCSQRRQLEAHHIVFQSRGGSDAHQNLTTLCAFHHRFGIHGGIMQLRGQARRNLHWFLPRQQFHGNLRISTAPAEPPTAFARP